MRVVPLTWVVLLVLVIINSAVLFSIFTLKERALEVVFLRVGQGDAIYIESPTGVQVLIDGGPDRSVLRQLSEHISPLDRTIDLVIATHPDKDHIAGLTGVFEQYGVSMYMEPGIAHESSYYNSLQDSLKHEPNLNRMLARRGMRLHLGGGAYADVLYPDRDVSGLETNEASIILRVVYGEHEFMLTGDAPSSIEDWTAGIGEVDSDVLKAGHHGSRTSTSEAWLREVNPEFVVVSAGDDNPYGHPHEEVVERIHAQGAQILSTTEESVVFTSDGRALRVR